MPLEPIHSDAAEMALLGCAYLDQGCIDVVRQIVGVGDWYSEPHRLLWQAMLAVHDDGADVDPVTLHAELSRMGRWNVVGGASYLDALETAVPGRAHPETYARTVAELARRRDVLTKARIAATFANDPNTSVEQVAAALDALRSGWECGGDELPSYSDDEIAAMTFPDEPEWLIDQWWEWEACGFIAANEKSHKTILAMGMALSVANGKPWLGRFPVKQGRVLFVAEEDHVKRVQRRMVRLAHALGLTWPTHGMLRFSPQEGCNITTSRGRGRVAAAVRKHKPTWLILDPFRQITPGLEEKDSGQVADILGWVRSIQKQNKCSVAIIDHLRKDPQGAPDQGRAEHQLRGSGAKGAWRDSFIFIKRKNEESPVHRVKALHRDGSPLPWQIVNVVWDEPHKGDLAITSHEAPKTLKTPTAVDLNDARESAEGREAQQGAF